MYGFSYFSVEAISDLDEAQNKLVEQSFLGGICYDCSVIRIASIFFQSRHYKATKGRKKILFIQKQFVNFLYSKYVIHFQPLFVSVPKLGLLIDTLIEFKQFLTYNVIDVKIIAVICIYLTYLQLCVHANSHKHHVQKAANVLNRCQ